MNAAVVRKLDRLEESPPIPMESVDFTIVHPGQLASSLGPTLQYFGRVEHEVSAEQLQALMPRLGTNYGGYESHGKRFLDIWVPQEQRHGEIIDEILRRIGLEPLPADESISPVTAFIGRLGTMSTHLHATVESIYLTFGSAHERLTRQGYGLMESMLKRMHETALVETVIKPILPQESGHLGYYRTAALDIRAI